MKGNYRENIIWLVYSTGSYIRLTSYNSIINVARYLHIPPKALPIHLHLPIMLQLPPALLNLLLIRPIRPPQSHPLLSQTILQKIAVPAQIKRQRPKIVSRQLNRLDPLPARLQRIRRRTRADPRARHGQVRPLPEAAARYVLQPAVEEAAAAVSGFGGE